MARLARSPLNGDSRRVSRSGLARMAALALLWGSGFLWVKLALRGFSAVQIVFIRLLLAFLVLAPMVLARGLPWPRGRRIWAHLFVVALVSNAVPFVLIGMAEETIGSNVAGVLNATTPIWTLLVAFAAGVDRHVTLPKAAGLTLGFLGAVVLFAPWQAANEIASPGGLAGLTAAACYGFGFVYTGRFLAGRGISPLVLSASQLGAATVQLAVVMPFAGLTPPTWRVDAVASLLILSVLGTGLAFVINFRVIEEDGPTIASTVTYLVPVVAVLLGWLVLGESVTATMLAGIVLILGGVALTRRHPAELAGRRDRHGGRSGVGGERQHPVAVEADLAHRDELALGRPGNLPQPGPDQPAGGVRRDDPPFGSDQHRIVGGAS
ncbi:protein of unknown function DUF6 transmembrane [Thermobispora bispora DSM 43833]|uniref:EamA domain-containing protein n=1 Tax=Thermobispora bispora (strain ATCC 19993 / DSM 43833 / CBS 139.67 / JCM 10125 / KCTC 9307 / NBRC 14880 / R51) TaxID=469371 RepID=D6YB84_THEBD|nr:DMT family transporter [Thermobispora bispora]ADG88444.1 protein of unknown function DUF6 transmembrane [Thermobispora bispora DSM 43833]MDI9580352.1 DMT family transporter [Thermobispora sp.]